MIEVTSALTQTSPLDSILMSLGVLIIFLGVMSLTIYIVVNCLYIIFGFIGMIACGMLIFMLHLPASEKEVFYDECVVKESSLKVKQECVEVCEVQFKAKPKE